VAGIVAVPGNIESLTYCPSIGGWIVTGWIGFGWDAESDRPEATLNFAGRLVASHPVVCVFERTDVRKVGTGVVMFIPDQRDLKGTPHDLVLRRGSFVFSTTLISAQSFDANEAIRHAGNLLAHAARSEEWKDLITLLARPHFTGTDTLDTFDRAVFMHVDFAFLCPPHGLWIVGWTLDPFGTVAKMLLRCGGRSAPIDPREWISISRSDVSSGFADQFGGLSAQCGFVAYVPDVYVPGQAPYIEIETDRGEIGFKPILGVRSAGIDTIKDLLGRIDLRYDELVRGFDRVIGPAIESINTFRLRNQVEYSRTDFGPRVVSPRCSIIVPLYGRMEFLEYQLAFFARTLSPDHEIIYVLDDPARQREVEFLASSCYARFRRKFTLVALAENVGYAPANNAGLRLASGDYICFLNSDVFPDEPAWLEYMLETAEKDPTVGLVGALLVFEDETVQHDGCTYEHLPEFGNWVFCMHRDKGLISPKVPRVHGVSGVTGACMVVKSDLARSVGGFDQGYVIGDFEDADLCEKVKTAGFCCVVDQRARLYHLERQSQSNQAASWRFNLTLYNAWRFQNRWVRNAKQPFAPDQSEAMA
jgi:GT2 family glycosyltransferase